MVPICSIWMDSTIEGLNRESIIVKSCDFHGYAKDSKCFRIPDFGDIFLKPILPQGESYYCYVCYCMAEADIRGEMPIPRYATPFLDKFLFTENSHPEGIKLLYEFITTDEINSKCRMPHIDLHNKIVYIDGVVNDLDHADAPFHPSKLRLIDNRLYGSRLNWQTGEIVQHEFNEFIILKTTKDI